MSESWTGEDEFYAALDKILKAADMATRELVATASATNVSLAMANFAGSHAKGQPHRGGSKPNIVTGTARRSIRADPITRFGVADYGTSVGPRVKYGRRLELGFRGSRGYPYFGPAATATASRVFRAQAAPIWQKHMTAAGL